MTDTLNTIHNTIIEHTVATETAVVDTIYETTEVLLKTIDQLRKEVSATNASVERLEHTINNLIDEYRIDEARDNARMRNEMVRWLDDFETKSVLNQKPEPVEDHVRRWARIMGY